MENDYSGTNVIVFGGCGFVGRHLVEYLVEKNLACNIRVVDKVPPQVAWLNERHRRIFNDSRVEFRSANLINDSSCANSFSGAHFHYAFNCASETKFGQSDAVYEEGVYKLGKNCAQASATNNVLRYVDISSAQLYTNQKIMHKEDSKIEPWTGFDKYKFEVENELKKIDNLSFNILRPGIIYGKGDRSGLNARIAIAGVYKYLGEKMTLFWNEDLGMHTVNVRDVCRAMWHLATIEEDKEIYNLTDEGKTTQGLLTEAIAKVFDISYDFLGSRVSSLCKMDINSIVNEVNDKHLEPWAKICKINGVVNTPLSPYIYKEFLCHRHLNLDCEKLKATGFQVEIPYISCDHIREIVEDYIEMNMFPESLLS